MTLPPSEHILGYYLGNIYDLGMLDTPVLNRSRKLSNICRDKKLDG